MNLFGLTDSLPAHQLEECPQCHSAVHVASGLCLRCLLQAGLAEGKDSRGQNLGVLLSEMSKEVNERVEKTDVLVKYWEIMELGLRLNSALPRGRTIWIADAHRGDGPRSNHDRTL